MPLATETPPEKAYSEFPRQLLAHHVNDIIETLLIQHIKFKWEHKYLSGKDTTLHGGYMGIAMAALWSAGIGRVSGAGISGKFKPQLHGG